MNTDAPSASPRARKVRFAALWRWTVELFSILVVCVVWRTPIVIQAPPWGNGVLWTRDVQAVTFPVIFTLFVTSCFSLMRHKWHAILGFVLMFFWIVGVYLRPVL